MQTLNEIDYMAAGGVAKPVLKVVKPHTGKNGNDDEVDLKFLEQDNHGSQSQAPLFPVHQIPAQNLLKRIEANYIPPKRIKV